jgi:nucleoside-diphosphate-sugar epimerase
MKIVLFGAGGPVAAAAIKELAPHHTLRLADIRPLTYPHEFIQTDVTDPTQVHAAAQDMDAIINLSVIRPDPIMSFRVNMLGAYNVMRAAVAHKIKRVVHTGPETIITGYWLDHDITADAPPRPGTNYYLLTKYLGQEVVRSFAEHHALEVIALYFHVFQSDDAPEPHRTASPFLVSWEDTGRAFRAAVEAPPMPNRYEPFIITGDLPHGKFSAEKAQRLLGWQPQHSFPQHWQRKTPRPPADQQPIS